MSEIAVLVPMLGRPHQAAAVMDSLFQNTRAAEPLLLFITSPGDDATYEACEQLRRAFTDGSVDVLPVEWEPGRGDYARKINAGFQATTAPFVFTGASDIRFTPHWDVRAMQPFRDDAVGVVGTDDQCNPRTRNARRHSTHSLVRRAYVDEHGGTADGTGAVLHEGYWHNFCDDELVQTALARRAYRPSRAVVRHLHPMGRGPVELDDTYRLGLARFDEDRQLYLRRTQLWRRRPTRRRAHT